MTKPTKKAAPAPAVPRYRVIAAGIFLTLCLLGIFAVRLHIEQLTGQSLSIFPHTGGVYPDLFLSCKETFYFLLALGMCAYAAGERLFPDTLCRVNPLYRRKALLPGCCIGGYFLLSCLSAAFSAHKEVVLRGVCTEFEGLSAVFAYCILFCFGFNFLTEKRIRQTLVRILLTAAAVTAIAAVVEYAVVPLMELPFMKYLIAPPQYREALATLRHTNSFREAVLMFYNANYAGAFFALLLPVPVYGILTGRHPAVRIGSATLCAALLAAGVMTNATTAFYVMAAELLLIVVVLAAKRAFLVKPLLIAAAAFLVLTVALDLGTDRAFSRTLLKSATNAGTYENAPEIYRLEEIRISGRTLYLAGEQSGYSVLPPYETGETLRVLPDPGTEYEMLEESDIDLRLLDKASGAELTFTVFQGILHVDCGYDSTIDFAATTEGLQLIGQSGTLLPEIPHALMADSSLTRYYSLFTGRGYIWVNSLPILKECLLLGKGAGNFPFYFVQTDVIGLSNTNGSYRFVIDKPHSFYLQIALTAGIPALLCILLLFGSFALRGLRCLAKASPEAFRSDSRMCLFLCLYAGICGYMVGGLINDSCITVSPVFWLLCGTAYSLCVRIEQGGEKA